MNSRNLSNWIRETLVLIAVGGVLLGAYFLRERLGNAGPPPKEGPFSTERETADKAYLTQDWLTAASNYKVLTERDPYNGYAWYALGDATWNCARRLVIERERAGRATVPDKQRIDDLTEEIKEIGQSAIQYLSKARETGRFRNMAGVKIATVYTAMGDKQSAVDLLTECYEDGMILRGLYLMPDFATLHNEPGFEKLAQRDRRAFERGGQMQSPVIDNSSPAR